MNSYMALLILHEYVDIRFTIQFIGQVLPSSVRGVGMGMTITVFWLLAFLAQSTFETTMELFSIPGQHHVHKYWCILLILW